MQEQAPCQDSQWRVSWDALHQRNAPCEPVTVPVQSGQQVAGVVRQQRGQRCLCWRMPPGAQSHFILSPERVQRQQRRQLHA